MAERHEDTAARIRTVALELFVTHGFDGTSLRHIADRLGFTKAALYYHYPSKSELIRSVIQPMIDDTDAVLDRFEAQAPVEVEELLGRWFDVLDQHRPIFDALTRDASGFAHVDLEEWAYRLFGRLQVLLVGEDAPLEQRARVAVAIGGLSRAPAVVPDADRAAVRVAAVAAACGALGTG